MKGTGCMIEDLNWTENLINWRYKEKKVQIDVEKTFLATIVKNQNFVCIKSGSNFVEEKVYFYSFEGSLILFYSIPEEKVEWTYKDEKMICSVPGLNQAMYLNSTGHIYILFNNKTVRVIERCSETICECNALESYVCQYLSQIDDKPVVVCDGECKDTYGRFRMNFCINEELKVLEKGGNAY